jgi:iron(III) transport system permease protein
MAHRSAGEATLVAALLALLAAAIAYPLLQVLSVAFLDGGMPTLRPLLAFFARPLFREAFVNTLLAGVLAVVIGSVIAVPLALLTVRYRFPGRALVPVLGVLPLVIPPFVGAVAFQQILGRSGGQPAAARAPASRSRSWRAHRGGAGAEPPLLPFILLNTAAALGGLDRSLEEAAESRQLGLRLFRRVLLPLALPGATRQGALSRSSGSIDDLGTPLMLNYTKLPAPQAHVRSLRSASPTWTAT